MKRILESFEYQFDAVTGQIDFSSINYGGAFEPTYILGVINLDANRGTLIYNPAGQNTTGGVWLSTFVVDLIIDTASMNNSDRLLVVFEDDDVNQNVQVTNTLTTLSNANAFSIAASGLTAVGVNLFNGASAAVALENQTQIIAQITAGASVTGGQFIVEGSTDNVNFVRASYALLDDPGWQLTSTPSTQPVYLSDAINVRPSRTYNLMVPSFFRYVRARISSTITGTGGLASITMIRNSDLQACQPVMGADRNFIATGRSALNENLLTLSSTELVNVSGYNKFSMHIIGSSGITAGAIIPEVSADGTNWTVVTFYNNTTSVFSSARTISASTTSYFEGPLPMRYFRVRISTAFTGGTVSMYCTLKQQQGPDRVYALGLETLGGVSLYKVGTTDVSSAAITTTTTTTPSSFNYQISGAFSVQVTAISGLGAYLDVSVEASVSALNTSTWFRFYDFPRITTTGTFNSPQIRYGPFNRIRYVQTIGGSAPSVTRQIARQLTSADPGQNIRSFIDRTILPNTLNSTTPVFFVDGMPNFNLLVTLGAGGTPGAIQLEGSDDNINWYAIGTPLTLVAGGTAHNHPAALHMARYVRARTSTAGTGTTLLQLTIRAMGDS